MLARKLGGMSTPADLVYTITKDKLPGEWSLATISDLVGKDGVFVDGDWVESKDQDPDGDVRLIQLADIGDGEYRNKSERFLTYEKAIQLGCTFLKKGDVLIARMPDPLGRACIFPGDKKKAVTVVDVAIVRPAEDAFDARWIMYFVNAPAFRSAVASMQSGSTRKRISRGNLSKIVLPVPPLDQQKRIVAEIEKQFSRLDMAVANLKRVKVNLKRYKASVLQSVTSGRLTTEQGRTENTTNWRWLTIVELASPQPRSIQSGPFGSNLRHSEFQATGKLVIGIDNVRDGEFSFGANHRISDAKFQELAKYAARPGDVLITVMATIGRVCVVPESIEPAIITKHVYRITVNRQLALPDYVAIALRGSHEVREQLMASVQGQTRPGLNGGLIKKIRVPIPPLAEQHRIVAEVDRRLSLIRETEAQVDANLKRTERMRQSILAKAFSA